MLFSSFVLGVASLRCGVEGLLVLGDFLLFLPLGDALLGDDLASLCFGVPFLGL